MHTHTHLPTRTHTMSYCLTPVQTIPTLQQQPKLLVLIITLLAENISRPLILVWLLLCWVWPTLYTEAYSYQTGCDHFPQSPSSLLRARQGATREKCQVYNQTKSVMQTYKHAFRLVDGKLLWKVIKLITVYGKRKDVGLLRWIIFWNINLINLFNGLESNSWSYINLDQMIDSSGRCGCFRLC